MLGRVPPLLPRFHRQQQKIEDECRLAKILLETGEVPDDVTANGRPLSRSADGHNRERARGIPIAGRASAGGASPGTDPVTALLRKEARGELRL